MADATLPINGDHFMQAGDGMCSQLTLDVCARC